MLIQIFSLSAHSVSFREISASLFLLLALDNILDNTSYFLHLLPVLQDSLVCIVIVSQRKQFECVHVWKNLQDQGCRGSRPPDSIPFSLRVIGIQSGSIYLLQSSLTEIWVEI